MDNPITAGTRKTFMGVRVDVVPAGTKINDDRTGQSETVPDGGAVLVDGRMYCTSDVYVVLLKEFGERNARL